MPGYETRNSLDSCSDEGDSAPFAQLFCFILSSAFKKILIYAHSYFSKLTLPFPFFSLDLICLCGFGFFSEARLTSLANRDALFPLISYSMSEGKGILLTTQCNR